MPIADKVAAAQKINEFLKQALPAGGFRLKYRITVDPQLPEDEFVERPEILVELAGPDAGLLTERGAELLRSFEHVALKLLRLESEEHHKVSFDCHGYKAMRMEELRTAAQVAADKVRKTGMPYQFGPMSARERRILHLALREEPDLRTESEGEGPRRGVVVHPTNVPSNPRPIGRRR